MMIVKLESLGYGRSGSKSTEAVTLQNLKRVSKALVAATPTVVPYSITALRVN